MIVANSQESIDVVFLVDRRNDESLVCFLESWGVCTAVAGKHAAIVSYRLFEQLNPMSSATGTSKHYVHRRKRDGLGVDCGPFRIARAASICCQLALRSCSTHPLAVVRTAIRMRASIRSWIRLIRQYIAASPFSRASGGKRQAFLG